MPDEDKEKSDDDLKDQLLEELRRLRSAVEKLSATVEKSRERAAEGGMWQHKRMD